MENVLVWVEQKEQKEQKSIKTSSLEALSYAQELANSKNRGIIAVGLFEKNTKELFEYGVHKYINLQVHTIFDTKEIAKHIAEVYIANNCKIGVLGNSNISAVLGAYLASLLEDGTYCPNVQGMCDQKENGLVTLKRHCFSNKVKVYSQVKEKNLIIGIASGIYEIKKATILNTEKIINQDKKDIDTAIVLINKKTSTSKISIDDAKVVIAGGRGLKSPDNWHLIEKLADKIGAATACTKAVSDLGWRPHSEHVGQTGKIVASDVYIAVGVSGAIQHLAGVNASKTKIVINIDPEAPFFKSADYGVLGDALDVLPELIEKL